MSTSKPSYHWVIAGCCFLMLFVNIGLPSTSFSVYQPYIVALPGIGDVGGSLVLTVRTATTFAAMFLVNAWFNRVNIRAGATVAALFTACAFFVFARADNLPLFCLGAVLAGVGYGFGGMVAMTLLVGRWFKSHVGRAVGIGSVGSGVASVVIPIIALQIIHNASLATAFFAEGVLALVCAVALALLLRNHPRELGLEPYHSEDKPDKGKRRKDTEIDFSALKPIPAHTRHLLMVAMLFVGAFSVGGMGYLSVLMTSEGYDPIFAGTMVSVAGLALTLSKYGTGEVIDHVGPRKGSAVAFAVLIAGLALCCLSVTGSVPVAVGAAVLYGAGAALGTVGISMWSLELTDLEHRARSVRNFQICYSLGGMLVNTFPGVLKALTGSYLPTYVIILAGAVIAFVIIIAAYRRYRPEMG